MEVKKPAMLSLGFSAPAFINLKRRSSVKIYKGKMC
jgi:hypothetical protein